MKITFLGATHEVTGSCYYLEAAGSRFHVGVQFHPEFKSRPDKAHPLFRELVRHSLKK